MRQLRDTVPDEATLLRLAARSIVIGQLAQLRLEALTIALGKFAGVADAQAATMSGSWQELKNTMHGFFVQLGEDAAPAIGFLERLGTTAANVLKDSFSDIPNIDSLKILIEALQQGQSYEEARKKYQPVAAKIFELPDKRTEPVQAKTRFRPQSGTSAIRKRTAMQRSCSRRKRPI